MGQALPTKAIVLCAGLGTRLIPLTNHWPKPAIPLLGAPLIRFHFAHLARLGVKEVGINTHHLPQLMKRIADEEARRFGIGLWANPEPVIQGTGGGIRGLASFIGQGETFWVFNGDILFAFDLLAALASHRERKAAATMVLLPMPEDQHYKAVEVDPGGRVVRIAKSGPPLPGLSPWHFTGIHLLEHRVFDFMRPSGAEDINQDVYPRMIDAGELVAGHITQGYWSDLGTPARYLATVSDLLFGQVPLGDLPGASPFEGATRGGGNYWYKGEDPKLNLSGPAFFDRPGTIHPTARIGSSVFVGQGSTLAAGCRLNRAVVLDQTQVEAGEALVDCIAYRSLRVGL